MSNWNELLRFARAHQGELTLSVYLEASPPDPTERQSWMVLLRQRLNDTRDAIASSNEEERAAFGRCVGALFDRIPSRGTLPRDHGWAFFVSAGGSELMLNLPPGVETSVYWGLGASVVPFLSVAEPEDMLIVQVDRQNAQLTRVHDGVLEPPLVLMAESVEDVGPIMSKSPRAGFHSGTRGRAGADEAQRQRRENTARLHAQTATRVAALAEHGVPIILGGVLESANQVLDLLPVKIRERAVTAADLRMGPLAAPQLASVRHALHHWKAIIQEQHIASLKESLHSGGHAAAGFRPAQRAAEHGALAELIFSAAAWRRQPSEIEALVQLAIAEGADVMVAEPEVDARLDGPGEGIIAGLRFPVAMEM